VDVLGVTDVGEQLGSYFPHSVTYHPSCHGMRLLRLGDRQLQLLRKVRGIELLELPDAEERCGFGGTFSVKNADTGVDEYFRVTYCLLSRGPDGDLSRGRNKVDASRAAGTVVRSATFVSPAVTNVAAKVRLARRRQLSQDEWIEKWVRSERALTRWVLSLGILVWTVICIAGPPRPPKSTTSGTTSPRQPAELMLCLDEHCGKAPWAREVYHVPLVQGQDGDPSGP
jgi:hypothetical protein